MDVKGTFQSKILCLCPTTRSLGALLYLHQIERSLMDKSMVKPVPILNYIKCVFHIYVFYLLSSPVTGKRGGLVSLDVYQTHTSPEISNESVLAVSLDATVTC
ncbi:hypothetical protein NQD34_005067 [Periophthalmus magnuspinnatus]|nr:hypothetical protein NQD34_005067 [Periophthalmus magnuspinnatus]